MNGIQTVDLPSVLILFNVLAMNTTQQLLLIHVLSHYNVQHMLIPQVLTVNITFVLKHRARVKPIHIVMVMHIHLICQ
jgi:hypothetical protein